MALIANGTRTLNPKGRTWQRVCASTLQPPLVQVKNRPGEIPEEEGEEERATGASGAAAPAVLPNTGDAHEKF
jgi:hypothetical protein